MDPFIPCRQLRLPPSMAVAAAQTAVAYNPANAPAGVEMIAAPKEEDEEGVPKIQRLALLTSKWWGAGGVKLTVSFLDGPAADLRARIVGHMNAWGQGANVKFVETASGGQVRIARTPGEGYYSYIGTDILHIAAGQVTMNLDSFTMSTPESEFYRVVRHETGHTLGFMHEHMRRQIVARIDPQKAIDYFARMDGWDAQTVREQVLTPLEDATLTATPGADTVSIMAYALPSNIMRDGVAVPGGTDIDPSDYALAAKLYPRAGIPPSPPPPSPPDGHALMTLTFAGPVLKGRVVQFVAKVAIPAGAYSLTPVAPGHDDIRPHTSAIDL